MGYLIYKAWQVSQGKLMGKPYSVATLLNAISLFQGVVSLTASNQQQMATGVFNSGVFTA